jgi:hypothetical protein
MDLRFLGRRGVISGYPEEEMDSNSFSVFKREVSSMGLNATKLNSNYGWLQ